MEGRECMNRICGKSNLEESVEGWPLKSGGFATLCQSCGTVYKNLVFCETFHSEDSGWRECASCGKRLHCGCIASCSLIKLLDVGGVGCNICSLISSAPSFEKHKTCSLTKNSLDQNVECFEPEKRGDVAETSTTYCLASESKSGGIDMPLATTYLNISLSTDGVLAEEKELLHRISSFQQGFKLICLLPNQLNSGPASSLENNSDVVPQARGARQPAEAISKNQLLPRYWPRITDQELQLISEDSNSTIVPLFEKVLSASDAGRIGRLVLPKACAEAYFPAITQPEGLPMSILDVKGNEWMLQFRFWPNNNSRMYVLEGISPCIQSMQLQAGDTVTFSRIDPEQRLLMGFRKALIITYAHKDPLETMNTFPFQGDPHLENVESGLIVPEILGSLKEDRNSSRRALSDSEDNHIAPSVIFPQRKRRNVGSKSKRLLIDGRDSLELQLTWEKVQDMLRQPPSVEPSTFLVDDHEFEEFEEPPVFAKQSVFVVRLSGEYEQFAQCDSCFKWRKLTADFLVPSKWSCQDNFSNLKSGSCSAPEALSSWELDCLLRMSKEFTKRSFIPVDGTETQGLEPSGNVAVIGTESPLSVAATTKHPRHRPGCSCIVCIQPPSGKGKHMPSCTCNVCMTVKRRFKTLMTRKKKRQSEVETAGRSRDTMEKETEDDSFRFQGSLRFDSDRGSETQSLGFQGDQCIDLNSLPFQEQTNVPSMMSLLQEASYPLDKYLRQKGLESLEIIAPTHDKIGFSVTNQEQNQENDQQL